MYLINLKSARRFVKVNRGSLGACACNGRCYLDACMLVIECVCVCVCVCVVICNYLSGAC